MANLTNRNRLLEKYVEVVRLDGLNTNKNVNIGINGVIANLAVSGTTTFGGGTASTIQALTAAATIAVPTTSGSLFTLTPAQNETLNAATVVSGQTVRFIILTSGTTSYTLTFGTNFRSSGTLATGTVTGKYFIVEFVSDGNNYIEVTRSTAE